MVGVGNRGFFPSVGRNICIAIVLLSVVALASCSSATLRTNGDPNIDVIDKVRSLDILPRYPQQGGDVGDGYPPAIPAGRISGHRGAGYRRSAPPAGGKRCWL